MPRATDKHKLLTRDQICVCIDQIAKDLKTDDPAEIFKSASWDTILHRSILREYYTFLLNEPAREMAAASLTSFAANFRYQFMIGQFDFAVASRPQQIARARGWKNLIGWDKASNEIVNPLTRVFQVAAAHSFIAQQFHDSAFTRSPERDAFQNFVMAYVHFNHTQGHRLPYLPIVLTQIQVSEYAIRARDLFERQTGRDMSVSDWDRLSPQIALMLTRGAAGSRPELFRQIATVACADDPFVLRLMPDGEMKLSHTLASEKAVQAYMHDTNGEKFFERYKGLDTTGCPALFSAKAEGGRSYFTQITAQLLQAVREDFWPEMAAKDVVPAQAATGGCPFHHAHKPSQPQA